MYNRFGTDLELKIFDDLLRRKVAFNFRTQLSGGFKYELGDPKANFMVEPSIIFRLLTGTSRLKMAADIVIHEQLVNKGLRVVDLWETDLISRFTKTMDAAIKGEEIG